MKKVLWNKEVDLDFTDDQFPTDEEMQTLEEECPGGTHGWFQSPSSNLQLHYRAHLPPDGEAPKAVIVWQHGIQSHSGAAHVLKSGRRTYMALLYPEMTKAGFAMYGLDIQGHGFSEGRRFYCPDFRVNRDDLDAFGRMASSMHDGVPLFIMGESYGGCLSLHVARAWQDDPEIMKVFHGVALTAPAIVGDLPPPPVVCCLMNFGVPFFPKWTPFFMPNPVSPERIWRDKEVIDIEMAPRVKDMRLKAPGQKFCLGTGGALVKALEEVRAIIPTLTVPFSVQHGTEDAGVPIEGTEYLLEKAQTPEADRKTRIIDGGFHALFDEPEPIAEETVAFMVDWVKERTAKTQVA